MLEFHLEQLKVSDHNYSHIIPLPSFQPPLALIPLPSHLITTTFCPHPLPLPLQSPLLLPSLPSHYNHLIPHPSPLITTKSSSSHLQDLEQLIDVRQQRDDDSSDVQTYFPRPGDRGNYPSYRGRFNRRGGRGGAPRSAEERGRWQDRQTNEE